MEIIVKLLLYKTLQLLIIKTIHQEKQCGDMHTYENNISIRTNCIKTIIHFTTSIRYPLTNWFIYWSAKWMSDYIQSIKILTENHVHEWLQHFWKRKSQINASFIRNKQKHSQTMWESSKLDLLVHDISIQTSTAFIRKHLLSKSYFYAHSNYMSEELRTNDLSVGFYYFLSFSQTP